LVVTFAISVGKKKKKSSWSGATKREGRKKYRRDKERKVKYRK